MRTDRPEPWTSEDLKLLRESAHLGKEACAKILDRSESSIQNKANQLGISLRKRELPGEEKKAPQTPPAEEPSTSASPQVESDEPTEQIMCPARNQAECAVIDECPDGVGCPVGEPGWDTSVAPEVSTLNPADSRPIVREPYTAEMAAEEQERVLAEEPEPLPCGECKACDEPTYPPQEEQVSTGERDIVVVLNVPTGSHKMELIVTLAELAMWQMAENTATAEITLGRIRELAS